MFPSLPVAISGLKPHALDFVWHFIFLGVAKLLAAAVLIHLADPRSMLFGLGYAWAH